MRLHVTAFSLTAGLIWGAAMLLVTLANLIWPNYGHAFLELAASIYPGYYPGYHPGSGIVSVISGTLYGLVDGAIGGALFAWVYNLLTRRLSGQKV